VYVEGSMTSGHDMGDPGPPPDDRTIPGEAYDLFLDGRRLLAERKPAEAAAALERARKLAPGFHSITELLGRAYYAGRRYDDAAEQFTAAVERDPADDYAHFALALTLLKQGHPAVAAGHLRMALAMRPGSEEYRRALRRAELARGDGHTEENGHG
jgi:tetratricopeptide (TPR) repeat protein